MQLKQTCRENEIPLHLPLTNSPDGNFGETVSPHFSTFSQTRGKLISPPGNSVSSLGKHNSPIFLQFPPNFPRISPKFPLISPDSPVRILYSFQYNFANLCTLSLSIMPILCILHVSLKMRIPHYERQRIINLGNSGGILGKSDEKLIIFFHLFSQVWNTFPSWGNLIPLISPVATVKAGEISKTTGCITDIFHIHVVDLKNS